MANLSGAESLRFFPTQTYSMILLFKVSFDLEQESKDLCLVYFTQSEQMTGPPQSAQVGLDQGCGSFPHGTAMPHYTWACTGCWSLWAARSQPSPAWQRSWPVKNHCHLSPGAPLGILQLSKIYGLSHSSVSVLACVSHRARRTRNPKSACLGVLVALKIDKKLGCCAKLCNKLEKGHLLPNQKEISEV